MRQVEPNIIDMMFGATQAQQLNVAVCTVPRVQVPQYDLADGTYVPRMHIGPHTCWDQHEGAWVPDVIHPEGDSRNGQYVIGPYTFRVHGLRLDQQQQARNAASKKNPDQRLQHMPQFDVVDDALYNAWQIYLATVPEDRARPGGWDDRQAWQRHAVGNGPLLVKKFLLAGEAVMALLTIAQISQQLPEGNPAALDETLGN
jgi:hypothetical protein